MDTLVFESRFLGWKSKVVKAPILAPPYLTMLVMGREEGNEAIRQPVRALVWAAVIRMSKSGRAAIRGGVRFYCF